VFIPVLTQALIPVLIPVLTQALIPVLIPVLTQARTIASIQALIVVVMGVDTIVNIVVAEVLFIITVITVLADTGAMEVIIKAVHTPAHTPAHIIARIPVVELYESTEEELQSCLLILITKFKLQCRRRGGGLAPYQQPIPYIY